MRGNLPFILLAMLASPAFAQEDTPFDREHFTDREGLQAAQAAIKEGNDHFQFGANHFRLAIPLFEKAHAFNPDNAELNMKLGLCHLNGRYRHLSLPYFKKAVQLDPTFPRAWFLLGYAYQLSGQWDAAIKAFEQHIERNQYTPDMEAFFNTADRHINECRLGQATSANADGTQVENLGPALNSEFADYGLLIAPDGNTIWFTSRRANSTGGKVNKATNEYFEDIYTCVRENGHWSEPVPAHAALNTTGNDATMALFNGGNSMLLYRDQEGAGDIYVSELANGTWSTPRALGVNVNSKHSESSAWVTADGRWLYFVSDRPEENLGGQDIYRSGWDATINDWGPAQNLGPDVNTSNDEEGVFVSADGTVYFSSKGLSTMGGYDVFRTREAANGRWSKPENLGWPVNSPDDDLFYVEDHEGTAYVSSVRSGAWGDDDIFRIVPPVRHQAAPDLTANAAGMAPEEIIAHFKVKGKVMDLQMLAGMEAMIELVDLDDPNLSYRFTSNANGEFEMNLPKGRRFAMTITADGFLLRSETIDTRDGSELPPIELALKPIKEGVNETLRNIFFARDKAVLESGSMGELGQLLRLLKENPAVRLEISGHTDSDGSAAHNQLLSEQRAQAVVDHLVANGVDAERLVAKGYGAAQPVAANDSDASKALNRRTEMKVLAN